MDDETTRKEIRERYGRAARQGTEREPPCCGGSAHAEAAGGDAAPTGEDGPGLTPCCGPLLEPSGAPAPAEGTDRSDRAEPGGAGGCAPAAGRTDDPVTADLYGDEELADLPSGLQTGSLGCGNPTALADLHEGETVLDLGSGAGLDVLLSARRVGPGGNVYGVDMTDEMLERARANAREAGVGNVEFLSGAIEDLPLPDASVDVVISNCVINLSTDKRRAIEEAYRVLRPGGRFAVADVVVRGPVPDAVRRSMELWVGCVAGALERETYRDLLTGAGFGDVGIETTRVYDPEDARRFFVEAGLEPDEAVGELRGKFAAAFVRARKPK